MTGPEMITEFQLLRDVFQSPDYDPVDIYGFINRAAPAYVDYFFPDDPNSNRGMGVNQRTVDNLHTLITTRNPTTVTSGIAALHKRATGYIDIPDGYRFFQGIEMSWDGGTTFAKKITNITFDEIPGLFSSPHNRPDNESNVYLCWHSNKILMFSSTASNFNQLYYIKNPATVSDIQPCDLPLHTHLTIVQLAYQISLLPSDELNKFQVSELLSRISRFNANT